MVLLQSIFILLISGHYQFSDAVEATVTSIDDVVQQKIEELRAAIPEPITVENYSLDLTDNDYLTGQLDVSDLKLSGIKGFNATLKYVLLPKSFILSFDYIELNSNYVSDLQLLNQPLLAIFGEGQALIALSNLNIIGNINVTGISTNLINSMEISLSTANFEFNGLMNDDDFSGSVNNYLNSNFANLFNQYSYILAAKAEDVINKAVGDILNGNSTVGSAYEKKQDKAYDTESLGEDFLTVIDQILSTIF